ncbi:MAG: amidohydrolase family protein [Thermotogaceae bacterium]|nr:amidohydrolase family protein [Thermotogaceae bacterium]
MHLISLGIKLLTHDLEKENLKELLESEMELLFARGWSNIPPLDLINQYSYPVILIRKCGHVAVVNDTAKKKLGLKDNLVYESDMEKLYEIFDLNFYKKALKVAEKEMLRVGVSYVHTDDLHGMNYEELVEILKGAKIRIYEKLAIKDPRKEMFGKITNRVVIGAIKLFADGSIGARTAYMKKPYKDTKDKGLFLLKDDEVKRIFEFGKENNVEICVHIIGDGAMEIMAEYFEKYPGNRIIHAQLVPKEVLPKLRNTRFSIQPHFYAEDKKSGLLDIINTDSIIYPFFELYKMGYDVSFSTDAPVSPHDPRYVIEKAMMMGFLKEDAIKLYTKGSQDFCYYEKEDITQNYPVAVEFSGGEFLEL